MSITRAFVVSLLLSGLLSVPTTEGADWKAGTAKIVITPDPPIWMSGYASRNKPAEGALHDLWVKALALEDPQGARCVLVTADLVGIPKSLSDAICGDISKKLRLGREAIMIATSHTHTGPIVGNNLRAMWDLPADESAKIDRYAELLRTKFVKAVEDAVSKLEPAKLAWANGTATFAVNRRNNPEPQVPALREAGQLKGPVDHEVPVLQVTAADGTLRALVFGYACHNTVLDIYKWSGDYAGFAQIELEKRHPTATALYFAGCGADQNPLPRRTVELAEKYGRMLADAVDGAVQGTMHPVSGGLATRFSLLDLPFDKLPTKEEIEQQAQGQNAYERRRAKLLLDQIQQQGALPPSYPYPIQLWRLGDGPHWVALGGEVVIDYSLRLKRELGPGRTWVAGYCNDVMAYIPSLRVLREGGYEGGGAMVYYGLPNKWGPDVEELIVGRVRELDRGTQWRE